MFSKMLSIWFIGSILVFPLHAFAGNGEKLIFTTQDFKPFSYMENGVVAGPAVDIITQVCQEMKTACEFKLYPWPRAQAMVREGVAHGMFLIGWNKPRTEWLHFSPPVLNTEYGFFINKENPVNIDNINSKQKLKVGVFGPSNTFKTLEKIQEKCPNFEIDMTPDDIAAFWKLTFGRVDCVFSNKDVGHSIIQSLGVDNIEYAGKHKSLRYFIGFSKQYTDINLVHSFNAAYLQLHRQGRLREILDSYGLELADYEPAPQ